MPPKTEDLVKKLKRLYIKRSSIRSRVESLNTYVTQNPNLTLKGIHLRVSKSELDWDEFDKIQSEIEELSIDDDFALAKEVAERSKFEALYFDAVGKAEEQRALLTPLPASHSSTPPPPQIVYAGESFHDIKLPVINLQTFSGNYDEWYSFYNLFIDVIGSNTKASDLKKFKYLKTYLRGEPLELIDSLEPIDESYEVALDLLKKRYDNPVIIVQKHVRDLFNVTKVEKENASSLRALIDSTQKHIRALKSLKQPTDQWDAVLIHLTCSKLDSVSFSEWQKSAPSQDFPTMNNLMDFLEHRCRVLEAVKANHSVDKSSSQSNSQKSSNNSQKMSNSKSNKQEEIKSTRCLLSQAENKSRKCPHCDSSSHSLFFCEDFRKMSVNERFALVKSKNLCLNCLKGGHRLDKCTASHCRTCNQPHNSLLHRGSDLKTQSTSKSSSSEEQQSNAPSNTSSGQSVSLTSRVLKPQPSSIMLSTAVVLIAGADGKLIPCRALLDSGSQSSFLTASFANRLALKLHNISIGISGLNNSPATISHYIRARIESRASKFTCLANFLVVPKITDYTPNQSLDAQMIKIPRNIILADPDFLQNSEIDMLIGADLFWQLIGRDQFDYPEQSLSFRESKLGWIVCSAILDVTKSQAYCHLVSCHIATDITLESIDSTLRSFWELENLNSEQELRGEDLSCEQLFQETTVRDSDGRYVVRMPLKDELKLLGNSKENAVKRLMLLEKRFIRNPELKAGYQEFINEYLRLGHMKFDDCDDTSTTSYFVPHHPVFKETSSTTKLRVVFDFSCKTSTGHSLNDISHVGPVIQLPLYSHLIRCRSYQICFCGDIEKMFRQIKICDDQIDLQKIVWRDSPTQPIQTYSLLTVSYGTSSASWLATRTLKQLALDYQEQYPESSKIVLDHFYMDDCISGANSIDKAIELKSLLISHLELGKFRIRKWSSNSPEFMDSVPEEDRELKTTIGFDKEASVRTLGLLWLPNVDSFSYSIDHVLPSNLSTERPTKRSVLSTIAKIFDPLGLLGPVISKAKIAMQGLWRQELDWDEPLSNSFTKKWRVYCRTLSKLKGFLIPRKLVAPSSVRIELHGFSDASMEAYGACIYLRCIDEQNDVHVNLITSKSRVAPIKTQSLPRLELCGAHLLAELADVVKCSLDCNIDQIVFWTDSTVVLSWLQAQPTKWTTFVANRVSKIQTLTSSSNWKHVASGDNPADLISRGMFADQLVESTLWFKGPNWLNQNVDFEHYGQFQITSDDELPDYRRQKGVVLVAAAKLDPKFIMNILPRVSSFEKLIRIIAYCLRYLRRRKNPKGTRPQGAITSLEFDEAKLLVIRLGQQLMFPQEIADLKKSKTVNKSSCLALLCPFVDKDGIIRVGGRLENSKLTPDRKHPIVLSYGGMEDINKLPELIARHFHEKNLHAGPQSLLSFIRQEYWPTNGRNLARKIYLKCVICFKLNPKVVDQQMAILPESRVEPTRPFYRCGVDYAGPIYIRSSSLRKNSPHVKTYISLFVCLSTKAIHVELVEDLTSASFIACLRRFMSRRGKPLEIHSDNGTTFVGSKRELEDLRNLWKSEVHRDSIVASLAVEGITWKFIPPRSPNFGGLWESSIKQVKVYLKKAIGNANLTYSEMYTVLTQVEACVNSRPLIPLSSDPNDYSVLTPSHFLIGDQLNATPEPNLCSLPENRLTRWQLVQRIAQHFWQRWRNEYLQELQRRYKWKSTCKNLQKGTLVLVKEDKSPPQSWTLARVEDTHPGSDGLVRVVTLRCPSGLFKRNVRLLCALPIDDTTPRPEGAAQARVSTLEN